MSTIFESGLSIISVLLIILFFTQNIYSAEYKRDEQPAPKSVEEFDDTISEYFKIPSRRRRLLPYLKEKIKNLPPFFSNSHIELNTRSYYFDRSNADVIDNVAWALGGSLNYESGLIKDILSVGAELFTSQKLYGPEDKDGTLLLKPGQEGFTVLGRAYANFNYRRMVSATFYRQY
ncbi:MAG: hypothetical protein GTO02_21520, partial [Candidatus Dadabacteria bacterium]|nr:hypothetical protein [Candidatus Dadabacteria bacterium]NIQ16864.1 hypothetical protein [Candidatus Dadabacteria bacterium]